MLKQLKDTTSRLARRLFGDEGQEGIATSVHEDADFTLQFGQLEVGSLHVRSGVWEFRYSTEFQAQLTKTDGVQPLVDFPDASKAYRSKELWPFFMARIPSISQPRVQEEIERQGLDQTSPVQLLRAFGERSIANPFLLIPA